MLLADFIAENQFLQILLFEFTIVASEGYMKAFQMSNFKNKNCSELLLTNGMGLDGAHIKFPTFKIFPLKVRPPNAGSYIYNFDITRYIQSTAMKIFNLLIEIN